MSASRAGLPTPWMSLCQACSTARSCAAPMPTPARRSRDQAVLAIDKVRYGGDPVAAVAAVDLDTAQAALELIDVVYDELPPVYAVEGAFAAGSPVVPGEPPP